MPSPKATRLIVATAVITAVGVTWFAIPDDSWRKWRAQRYAKRAAELAKSGGKDAARSACLRALALDRDSLLATRTLLSLLPPENLHDALLMRVRIADLDPKDFENLRLLALTAILTQRFDIADKVAGDLNRTRGETLDVLELKARIPAARGDFQTATIAAKALLEQAPGNGVGRLIFALSQVFTGAQTDATERELTALSSDPAVRVEALRGLRDAALRRKDETRALEIAETITSEKRAIFPDWLVRAELAAKAHPERVDALLAELTTHAGNDPRALGRIATWLRQSGRADLIEPWIASNDTLKRDNASAELIRAETFATHGDWEKLGSLLATANWRELEFLRLALLARVARGRHDEVEVSKAWRAATTAALADPNATRMLADAVRTWPEFDPEFEALLWRVSKIGVQNSAWTLTELFRRAVARKDTRSLRKVSEAMCEANPQNEAAKNNLAFYSLLLEPASQRAHRMAEELYKAHPGEGAIASTYALALLQHGQATEALAVLEKLPAEVLKRADLAPYHALALAGAGAPEKAQTRAAEVIAADLLPEEQELMRAARLPLKP